MNKEKWILLKTRIYAFYFYGKDTLITWFVRPPKVMSTEETLEKIIRERCSVSRFGDGEFKLFTDLADLKYQKRNLQLKRRLIQVLKSKDEGIMVCIPKVFTKKDLQLRTEESGSFWKKHMAAYRLKWYKCLNKRRTYYNASFTRNYIGLKDKSKSQEFFKQVKKIWQDRELLIIEGQFSRLGVGNTLFDNAKSVQRILAPGENAFSWYEKILQEAKKYGKDKLILIALGPTATVLAYDLYKAGFQAIDIGHLDIEYEWFLKKAEKKMKIENKYVIEAGQRIQNEDGFKDERYESQIISKVGISD